MVKKNIITSATLGVGVTDLAVDGVQLKVQDVQAQNPDMITTLSTPLSIFLPRVQPLRNGTSLQNHRHSKAKGVVAIRIG